MPLLPKEPDIHPDDLFALPAGEYPWAVAHVRSRQEKALARFLRQRLVPFYLPQMEHRTSRAGRQFVSWVPLFPGYVFFRGGRPSRDAVWESGVVARIIDTEDQEQLDRELRQLRQLQESGASLIPYEEILPGDAVDIREGPFRGYVGQVVRHGRSDRLIVSISLLRKSVAVDLERQVVKRRRAL